MKKERRDLGKRACKLKKMNYKDKKVIKFINNQKKQKNKFKNKRRKNILNNIRNKCKKAIDWQKSSKKREKICRVI